MRTYVLVETENVCCGHGDYRDMDVISDEHPAFSSKEDAETYRKRVDDFNFLHVKELELLP